MARIPPTFRSRYRRTCSPAILAALLVTGRAVGGGERGPSNSPPPLDLTVKLLVGGEVFGPVLDHTGELLVLEYRGVPIAVEFNELKVASAYRAKKALLARQRGGEENLSAEDRFQLGQYASNRDHPALATKEFLLTEALDASYRGRIDAALREYHERKRNTDRNGPASRLEEEPPHDRPVTLPGLTETVRRTGTMDRRRVIGLYTAFGQSVRDTINQDLVLIETDHFLIWTDWNRVVRPRLVRWCEAMYRALCVQFGLDSAGNVFLGKCPIFCFRNKARFLRFARTYDHYDRESLDGYTRTDSCGHAHVVLFRRGPWDYEIDRFAGTLVHEGVHAFLHRYQRTGHISGWVGEGLADYIAEQVLGDRCPNGERADLIARQYVLRDTSIVDLLRSARPPRAHEYPVACSVVGFLVRRDRQAFASFIGDLKAGHSLEQALKRSYDGMTFKTLDAAWRQWVRAK